jgi:hypothetical protein
MGERKRTSKVEWQVIRLRARGEYLGRVIAPDEEAATKAAAKNASAGFGGSEAAAAAPMQVRAAR